MGEIKSIQRRFLVDSIGSNDMSSEDANGTDVILFSLRVYGSIFVVGLLVYCFLRKKYPRIFAVRQRAINCKHPLAREQFGYVSWMWKVFSYEPDVLLDAVGLDAVCFIRLLSMGSRLAGVGCFNSIWLLAVYGTSPQASRDEVSGVEEVRINSLPLGSPRFAAPILASYLFYAYTFYTMLKEFKWFIAERHKWLRKFNERNYTILVRSIPKDLQSDTLLLEHFQMLYRPERVLEAHVLLHIGNLESQVARREACVANLEHALAKLAIEGKRPKHVPVLQMVESTLALTNSDVKQKHHDKMSEVDSIEFFTKELKILNTDITEKINQIEKKQRPKLTKQDGAKARIGTMSSLGMASSATRESKREPLSGPSRNNDNIVENLPEVLGETSNELLNYSNASPRGFEWENEGDGSNRKHATLNSASKKIPMAKEVVSGPSATAENARNTLVKKTAENTTKRAKQAKDTVLVAKSAVSSVLSNTEDGMPDNAAFVTFSSLIAMQAALQMSQHPEPFVFDTEAAPGDPDSIFWKNVGRNKEVRQTGFLITTTVAVALCCSWTLLVALIVNLTKIQYLSTQYPRLEATLDQYPWIESVLTLVSPFLLLIFNSGLLPIILERVSRLEFPASSASLEASAFWKIATFTIIQTFFVSLISGSIIQQVGEILEKPQNFITFLAKELPNQSSYFTQLLIVSTCGGTLLELFRIVPLLEALGRKCFGRNLTLKERNTPIGFLRPLAFARKFHFARVQARHVLYFMVLFVYSTISPLICWFCFVFFLLLRSVYRHQFVFNFPSSPDSGGEVWLYFMHVLLACILISQLTLTGFLILKDFDFAIPLMAPLITATCVFIIYLHQRHFTIGRYLAARACLSQDLENEEEGVDYRKFKDSYKHPALMERVVEPDWDSGKNETSDIGIALFCEDLENRLDGDSTARRALNQSDDYGTKMAASVGRSNDSEENKETKRNRLISGKNSEELSLDSNEVGASTGVEGVFPDNYSKKEEEPEKSGSIFRWFWNGRFEEQENTTTDEKPFNSRLFV